MKKLNIVPFYMGVWGAGYAVEEVNVLPQSFFSEMRFYSPEDIAAIHALKPGEVWRSDSVDYHTVELAGEGIELVDNRFDLNQSVFLCFGEYNEGNLFIGLKTHDEDWCDVTVYKGPMPDGMVTIKNYSENAGMAKLMFENGIIKGDFDFSDGFVYAYLVPEVVEIAKKAFEQLKLVDQKINGLMEARKSGAIELEISGQEVRSNSVGSEIAVGNKYSADYRANIDLPTVKSFGVELRDLRVNHGMVCVDVSPLEGNVDDTMHVEVGVDRLPGTTDEVQSVELGFGDESTAAFIYKAGANSFMISLEHGMELEKTALPDGEVVYIIKSCD